ncbi:MAG: hypothetical protein IKC59_04580, partial [Clostridia bacterium]|nr:hypothetical protein [Clostridia bacterium]
DTLHPVYDQTDLDVKTFEDQLYTVMYSTVGMWGATPVKMTAYDASIDSVNKASYDRDLKFEELTGATLSYIPSDTNPNDFYGSNSYSEALRKMVSSGDISNIDMVMLGARTVGVLLAESFCMDLNEYDNYIHTDNSYYNVKFNNEMSLAEKQFFAMGYHTTGNIKGTEALLVNNTALTKQHQDGGTIDEIYQLALNQEWTYEKMMTYDKGFASGDINEDPTKNTYTLIMSANASQGLYYEMGGTLVEKDDQDMPLVTVNNTKNQDLLSFIKNNVTNNEKVTIVPNDGHGQVFINGQGLFMLAIVGSLGAGKLATGMDERLMPAPTYAKGEEYNSYLAAWNANVVTIPATIGDADKAAYCFELYMALSYNYIYPEYYEKICQLQYVENSTESQIYDLITDNIYVDYSNLYGFVGTNSIGIRPIFIDSKTEVGSLVQSVSDELRTGIDNFLNNYDLT